MVKYSAPLLLFLFTVACSEQLPTTEQTEKIGGPCDGCELLYEGMPDPSAIGSTLNLNTNDRAGEPLQIHGKVLKLDGKTPGEDIVLYIYHTNAAGLYGKGEHQTTGLLHGEIRGWVKTNDHGLFELKSIRPGAYPDKTLPEHIHIFVKEPDKNEYYIDEVRFLDDPLLKDNDNSEQRGGDLNIALEKDSTGTWQGDLKIILGKNIPHYR